MPPVHAITVKWFRRSDSVASDLQAQQECDVGNQSLSHWSIEFFEESFPSDHVWGNVISNPFSDLVMGDHFSEGAFILGDHCRPASDRARAGGKIIIMGGLMAGGGIIVRGLMRGAGGLISAGKKLLGRGGKKIVNLGGEGEVAGALNVQGQWITDASWRTSRNANVTLGDLRAAGNEFVIAAVRQQEHR